MECDKNDSEWETRITELMNSELKDLISEILENWMQEIQIMRQALDTNNYEVIRNISHKMKGTGGVFGLGRISEMGGILETAATNRNADEIRKTLHMLASYIEQLAVVY